MIQINGDNPAIIHVGDSYQDLGAAITGPTDADKNLGLKYFLNGALISDLPTGQAGIVLDTSAVATDTIDYVATLPTGQAGDPTGLTSTSTWTVIIEPSAAPSIVPDYTASITIPATSSSPATVASSTAQ